MDKLNTVKTVRRMREKCLEGLLKVKEKRRIATHLFTEEIVVKAKKN